MNKLKEFNGMEIEETKEINGGYWWLRIGHHLFGELYMSEYDKAYEEKLHMV